MVITVFLWTAYQNWTLKKGIELTIDSTGDNNASGEYQAWRHGLRVETQGKVDLGTAVGSVITINSNAAES